MSKIKSALNTPKAKILLPHPLTDEDIQKICNPLELKSIPDNTRNDLQAVVDKMFKWSTTVWDPRPAQYKKKMERIQKHASALYEEIEDVLFAIRVIDDYQAFSQQLSNLIKKTELEIRAIPKDRRGRRYENIPLRMLIEQLFDIYEATTGKRPTLSSRYQSKVLSKKDKRPGGKFFDFVKTFIEVTNSEVYSTYSDNSLWALIEDEIYVHRKAKKN